MFRFFFQILALIGICIISILAFIVPSKPFETFYALTVMTSDRPIWICFIQLYAPLYLAMLWGVYEKIKLCYNQEKDV